MEIGTWSSDDESAYFIAEVGVNHDGDVDTAKELIDAAAQAGADAVKFQTFHTDRLVTNSAQTADYQESSTGDGSQRGLLANLELTESEHRTLKSHCNNRKIEFLSTPFGNETAAFLDSIDVQAFKIGSGDLTNHPLLKQVAKYGKPLVVSTGMSTLAEVRSAFSTIRETNPDVPVALLHCVSAYPTEIPDANLRAMDTLEGEFSIPVGFSDHTTLVEMPAFAVSAGAKIVEKHFTLDRSSDGPDHEASLEPSELERAVSLVRKASRALGDGVKQPVAAEEETRSVARKGLYAAVDLEAGRNLQASDIAVKRPREGLTPDRYEDLIGRKLERAISRDEPLTEAHLREI